MASRKRKEKATEDGPLAQRDRLHLIVSQPDEAASTSTQPTGSSASSSSSSSSSVPAPGNGFIPNSNGVFPSSPAATGVGLGLSPALNAGGYAGARAAAAADPAAPASGAAETKLGQKPSKVPRQVRCVRSCSPLFPISGFSLSSLTCHRSRNSDRPRRNRAAHLPRFAHCPLICCSHFGSCSVSFNSGALGIHQAGMVLVKDEPMSASLFSAIKIAIAEKRSFRTVPIAFWITGAPSTLFAKMCVAEESCTEQIVSASRTCRCVQLHICQMNMADKCFAGHPAKCVARSTQFFVEFLRSAFCASFCC